MHGEALYFGNLNQSDQSEEPIFINPVEDVN